MPLHGPLKERGSHGGDREFVLLFLCPLPLPLRNQPLDFCFDYGLDLDAQLHGSAVVTGAGVYTGSFRVRSVRALGGRAPRWLVSGAARGETTALILP